MVDELGRNSPRKPLSRNAKNTLVLTVLSVLILVFFFACLMVGPANLGFLTSLQALFGIGERGSIVIVQTIRLPRALAALIAGAGLSVAGLIMQTTLKNPMASPATLGVSNAAVFGANLAIIGFAGGFLSTGNNIQNYVAGINPYLTSAVAFFFAFVSTLLILGLCKIRSFSAETVVLAGLALGTVWGALTTLLQYYATDVGLAATYLWSFGSLDRATFETDWIMLSVVAVATIVFFILQWRFNALSSGEEIAQSLGVKVSLLRFVALLLASTITAVVVSYLGVIGFVGLICPHAMKRIVGHNHKILIPASLLSGSLLLLFADFVSTLVGRGTAIPIGAVTALLGGPFFLYLIFARKGDKA